jgi:hypothetical protein
MVIIEKIKNDFPFLIKFFSNQVLYKRIVLIRFCITKKARRHLKLPFITIHKELGVFWGLPVIRIHK